MGLEYKVGYEYTSVIGDKEVKFKGWTAKEERAYLTALEKEKDDFSDKTIYDILIRPSIEDKEIVLSSAERKKLLVDIRTKSISEFIEDKHTCPVCNNVQDIKIKIEDIIKYVPSTFKNITIDDLIFSLEDLNSNEKRDSLKLKEGIINYIFNEFLLHIKSISIDGVLHENLKFKELKEFMDSLPTKIFDEVFEGYKDMIDYLDMEYKFKCNSCYNEETIDYSEIPNFLWA